MKFVLLIAVVALVAQIDARSKSLVQLTEDNWKQVTKGEWMVEMHAPWCPACKDLSKTWDSFASWSKDLSIQVGEVDVTANPGLSGRFLVTALPTIYHVKDGVYRVYAGPRDKEDFMQFIEQKKWTVVEPLASWKNPESIQMSVVAQFFRLSMSVRDLHTHLIEVRGLPVGASYAVFGVATLLLGCILGFFIVCIIDCAFPAGPSPISQKKAQQPNKKKAAADKKKAAAKKEETHSQSEAEGSQASQTDAESSADEAAVRQRKGDNKKENNNNNKSPKKGEGKKKK